MQLFDRDFFSSNDIICTTELNLRRPIEDVSISKRPLQITKKYYESCQLKKDPKDYHIKELDSKNEFEFNDNTTFYLPFKKKVKKEGEM